MNSKNKQLVVLSAPSGAGKTTLAKYLLTAFPHFKFSISATTRTPRPNEVDGKDYHFLTKEEFEKLIKTNQLVEFEEIFGNYYGTLRNEVEKSIEKGEVVVFDIDVKGALSIKSKYPEQSLLIFVAPPSLEVLEQRLIARGTESPEQLAQRLERIRMEMGLKDQFDYVVVNDELEKAQAELLAIVQSNII
jgi:guanylate kinase